MSYSNSVPSESKPIKKLNPTDSANQITVISPDYESLVKFLLEPFLESDDYLSVDCEVARSTAKVWVRLAFESEDKGRIFGRGGRNIQAIRTILEVAAETAGQKVYLEIFGNKDKHGESADRITDRPRIPPRRPTLERSQPRTRTRRPG